MTEEELEVGNVKVEVDTIFPTGYVIMLGNGAYFRAWRRHKIIATKLCSRARYFPTAEAAEAFIKKRLAFVGIEMQLCFIAWVLISWDEVKEAYWQGFAYDLDEKKAVRFLSYDEAQRYQKEKELQESGVIELHRFCEKQIQVTAA